MCDVVIYHEGCADGICSMYAIKKAMPDIKTIGCRAGNTSQLNFEELKNKKVMFVDICPDIKTLENLRSVCSWITILDHHKTSFDVFNINTRHVAKLEKKLELYLDLDRAGCQMAWDYVNRSIAPKRPWFVDYIADRDLWKFELPYSKEINAALYEHQYLREDTIHLLENVDKDEMIEKGKVIIEKFNREVEDICEQATECKTKTYRIWILTTTNKYKSEVGNQLSKKAFSDNKMPDFVVIWQKDPNSDDVWISMRNIDILNLNEVAKEYHENGGGHFRAAGFTLNIEEFRKEFNVSI